MLRIILPLLLLIGSALPALCDDTVPPDGADKAADMQSMSEFLQANPGCREFTDSCSYCTVADGAARCSTPQIACIKKAYQCTARSTQ